MDLPFSVFLFYRFIMKGQRFIMSLKRVLQIPYERCYRFIIKKATDSLLFKCNFMIIFRGNAILGHIGYVKPLKVLTITVMHF